MGSGTGLTILLCLVHLFTAASPLTAYEKTDYALADCQRQRVSVRAYGKSSTTTSHLEKQCGKKTVVEYESSSQLQLLEFSLLSRGRKCNETFRLFLGRTGRTQVVLGERHCRAAVERRGKGLAIRALGKDACCDNIRILSCTSAPQLHQRGQVHVSKRGLSQHSNLHHQQNGMEVTLAGIFSGTLLLVTTIASVTAFVRCCRSKPDSGLEKPPIDADSLDQGSSRSSTISSSGDQYKQYIMDRPYYPCPSSSCSPCSSHSSCPPVGSYATNVSFVSSVGMDAARQYLANRQLPDLTETLSEDNPPESTGEESDSRHIYFTLDACRDAVHKEKEREQEREEETDLDAGSSCEHRPRSRKYFVLEVTEDGPLKKESTGDVSGATANRLYHMLEPLHEEAQLCSLCQQCIERKQDSVYLVILPDDYQHNIAAPIPLPPSPPPSPHTPPPPSSPRPSSSSSPPSPPPTAAAATTMSGSDGEASQARERAGVELGAEGRKEVEQKEEGTELKSRRMYYTLEQPPAVICMQCMCNMDDDPIYNEVDDASSVPDPIYEKIRQDTIISQTSNHTYSTVPSFDLDAVPDQAMAEVATPPSPLEETEPNEDYASIPSSPIYSQPNTSSPIDLREVVTSLRSKMFQQLHHTQRSRSPSPSPLPSAPAPEHSSLVTAEGNTSSRWDPTDSRALLVAQRKRTGSYVMLNDVDSIWRHQQQNRYAPVSIVKPISRSRTASRGKNPMRDLHQRMLDHRYHLLREQQESQVQVASDYEVPVSCLLQSKVPPPRLLRKVSRQGAVDRRSMCDPSEPLRYGDGEEQCFRPAQSEPCLNLAGMQSVKEEDAVPPSPSRMMSPMFKSHSVKLCGSNDRKDPSLNLPPSPSKSPQKRMTYPFL